MLTWQQQKARARREAARMRLLRGFWPPAAPWCRPWAGRGARRPPAAASATRRPACRQTPRQPRRHPRRQRHPRAPARRPRQRRQQRRQQQRRHPPGHHRQDTPHPAQAAHTKKEKEKKKKAMRTRNRCTTAHRKTQKRTLARISASTCRLFPSPMSSARSPPATGDGGVVDDELVMAFRNAVVPFSTTRDQNGGRPPPLAPPSGSRSRRSIQATPAA